MNLPLRPGLMNMTLGIIRQGRDIPVAYPCVNLPRLLERRIPRYLY